MSNLTVKKGENGKYGFVDDAGNWVIEPKLLKAFVWNELGVVHFEEKADDGQTYDGWTIFKLDNPSEYNERTYDTGMGGDYGWYEHMTDLEEDDDPEYLEAWDDEDWVRIYPDGKILADDEIEDEEEEDWDDEDE